MAHDNLVKKQIPPQQNDLMNNDLSTIIQPTNTKENVVINQQNLYEVIQNMQK